MTNRVIRSSAETDAWAVLNMVRDAISITGKMLHAKLWINLETKGIGYHLQDYRDPTRKISFEVHPLSSRIKVYFGFDNEFTPESGAPLGELHGVKLITHEYPYNERQAAGVAILNWIYHSKLTGFTTAILEEQKPKVITLSEIPKRNYAEGARRKRNNAILHILEMAETGVVAYDVIQNWFFNHRSARETVRRVKRIMRYGYSLHFGQHEFGHQIFIRDPNRKLIDIKLAITKEHATRLKDVWASVDDAAHNEFYIRDEVLFKEGTESCYAKKTRADIRWVAKEEASKFNRLNGSIEISTFQQDQIDRLVLVPTK